MASVRDADKAKAYFPLAGMASDGYSKEDEATATCMCGAIQLAFPTNEPGLTNTFVCHCTDCHKLSSSMFCSNFVVLDTHVKHLRGQDNLTAWGEKETIASGGMMTNYFCKTCGTLMYRIGEKFPGTLIMRIGTVDDFNLMETKLKPRIELFTKDRASWLKPLEGVQQAQSMT